MGLDLVIREQPVEFWYFAEKSGNAQPLLMEVYEFLSSVGFRVKIHKEQSDRKEIFKINGCFIEVATISDLQESIINFLKKTKKLNHDKFGWVSGTFILEGFAKYRWSKIFDDKNLHHLQHLEENTIRHTRKKATFFFLNGFAEVTAKGVIFKKYENLSGFVYESQVIQHSFALIEDPHLKPEYQNLYEKGYCFLDFLNKICQFQIKDESGKPVNIALSESKRDFLFKIIGFLIHGYKQKGLTDWMPIFCDNDKGGSGKGVIIDAIALMQKTCVVDCQKDIPEHSPADLTPYTRLKVLDDLGDSFNLKQVFVEITGQTSIRQMYKPLINVPWEDSWKLVGTSNKLIRGTKDKYLRRYKAFDLFPYFGREHTIFDQYGHYFFSQDWGREDYNFLFSLMLNFCQMWLESSEKGKGDLNYIDESYAERFIEEQYPLEFRLFMEGLQLDVNYKKSELFKKFVSDNYNVPFIRKMTSNSFGRMLTSYLNDMKIEFFNNHNRTEIFIGNKKVDAKDNQSRLNLN